MKLQINEDQTACIQSRKQQSRKINEENDRMGTCGFLTNIRLLIEMYYLNGSKVMKFQMNKDQTA